MKLIVLAALFGFTAALVQPNCENVRFRQKYYNIDVIKEGINNLHEIVFNRNDNTAYFTFDQISEVPTRTLGYVKLDTKEAGVIGDIRNATGLALDQNLNRLYVGGSNGLYFINGNRKEKVAEKLPVDDDVRSIFFKDNVVYYVNKHMEANKFEFGHSGPVYELNGIAVDKIIEDDDNNIFFVQNSRLFRVKLGTRIVNSHEKYIVKDISVDLNFKPYVTTTDGVYAYNKYKYVLDKVSELRNLKKITFINIEEPLYVVADKLIRLQYNPVPCLDDVDDVENNL